MRGWWAISRGRDVSGPQWALLLIVIAGASAGQAQASCGDYLDHHGHFALTAAEPAQPPVPEAPCRDGRCERGSVPAAPPPAISLLVVDDAAWSGRLASRLTRAPSDYPQLVSDACPSGPSRSVDPVPR